MKTFLILYLLLVTLYCQSQEIKINPGKYSDFYHIEYKLNLGAYRLDLGYGFNEGGQFQIFVPKEHFPIQAPNCANDIIVRMPYSDTETNKRKLYNALIENQSIKVIIELNPYVKLVSSEPLKLELTYCNVFFRQRDGDYFANL